MKKLENTEAFFIDLDDTIFDFQLAEHVALRQAMLECGLEPTDEIMLRYNKINLALWKDLERGETTRELLMIERFRRLYQEMGIEGDSAILARKYPENLSKDHFWLPGARETLISLRKKYRVYVASNGTSWVQRGRINSSDLESLVDGIFVSEELGANKPAQAYFRKCFELTGEKPETSVMVGDSLSSDILGGKNAGMKTVWVNKGKLPEGSAVEPDFQIEALAEIVQLL